jgi:hypothetical protein
MARPRPDLASQLARAERARRREAIRQDGIYMTPPYEPPVDPPVDPEDPGFYDTIASPTGKQWNGANYGPNSGGYIGDYYKVWAWSQIYYETLSGTPRPKGLLISDPGTYRISWDSVVFITDGPGDATYASTDTRLQIFLSPEWEGDSGAGQFVDVADFSIPSGEPIASATPPYNYYEAFRGAGAIEATLEAPGDGWVGFHFKQNGGHSFQLFVIPVILGVVRI